MSVSVEQETYNGYGKAARFDRKGNVIRHETQILCRINRISGNNETNDISEINGSNGIIANYEFCEF